MSGTKFSAPKSALQTHLNVISHRHDGEHLMPRAISIAELPAWPLLLRAADAAAYLSYTRVQFRALVAAGIYPEGRERIRGEPRWNREELDECERTRTRAHQADEKARARQECADTIARFEPKVRRKNS
jgi:hypothetical protein